MQNTLIHSALQQLADGLQTKAEEYSETPSEWIQKYFYVPDPRDPITGEYLGTPGPIHLASHQCDVINEALARKPDGTLKYSTIIYSAPKKSGKSAITSAVVKYMAHHSPYSNLYCLANDGKQANDRLYGPVSKSYTLHRRFSGPFAEEKPNLGNVTLSNGTRIEAIPVDAAGEAGSQPLMTAWCFDEETEILTADGWKKYDEYSIEDKIATLSPIGLLEYQNPLAINIHKYSGTMHLLETKHSSICVSPYHNLYGKFYNHNKDKHISKFEKNKVEVIPSYKKYAIRVESPL